MNPLNIIRSIPAETDKLVQHLPRRFRESCCSSPADLRRKIQQVILVNRSQPLTPGSISKSSGTTVGFNAKKYPSGDGEPYAFHPRSWMMAAMKSGAPAYATAIPWQSLKVMVPFVHVQTKPTVCALGREYFWHRCHMGLNRIRRIGH